MQRETARSLYISFNSIQYYFLIVEAVFLVQEVTKYLVTNKRDIYDFIRYNISTIKINDSKIYSIRTVKMTKRNLFLTYY